MNEKIYSDSGYITDKFVEYQKKAKPVYLDFLLNYANRKNLDCETIFLLLFFFAFSYSEIDAIYIFETIDISKIWESEYIENYFDENNKYLNFCSARIKFQNKKFFCKSLLSYYRLFISK